ncbi:SMR family transporter [Herbiconiux sp.]|jgi:small multidrug resistance pump|uniref:DMT family transporter n=1 Tax=Herbiconiux sp. TaxID=1871186 RepID=UPI0025BC2855|nr:SMR family transporter [Herbiconiux sp.]
MGWGWALLAGAILFEVAGTLSLRMATHGKAIWYLPVGVCCLVAFTLLALTLASGVPLAAAYGTWTAVGVALTAVAGRILFKESLTWLMGLGIALIVGGVLLIELGH